MRGDLLSRTPGYGRSPDGAIGLLPVFIGARWKVGTPPDYLADCLALRTDERPWLLRIWEPLPTKAPAPPKARPYCCYIRTVIFYHFPHIVRGPHPSHWGRRWHWNKSGGFLEWDQIETRLSWDDVVSFEGERFEIQGGHVVWRRRRWWMARWARRQKDSAA